MLQRLTARGLLCTLVLPTLLISGCSSGAPVTAPTKALPTIALSAAVRAQPVESPTARLVQVISTLTPRPPTALPTATINPGARQTAIVDARAAATQGGNAATVAAAKQFLTQVGATVAAQTTLSAKQTQSALAGIHQAGQACTNRIGSAVRAGDYSALVPGATLFGCDLHGLTLFGLDLSRANLAWANLAGADLHHTNLAGANLGGADLTGANLDGANLTGATLTGSIIEPAALSTTVTSGANLSDAIWSFRYSSSAGGGLSGVAWSMSGDKLAAALHDDVSGAVVVYDMLTGRELRRFPDFSIPRWNPKTDELAIARISHSDTNHVVIWTMPETAPILDISDIAGDVDDMAWSPDGKYLAFSSDTTVSVWDVGAGKKSAVIQTKTYSTRLAWAPDSSSLATTGEIPGQNDPSLYGLGIWQPSDGNNLFRAIPGQRTKVIKWSPDGKLIAALTDNEKSILLIVPQTGEQKLSLSGQYGGFRGMTWSPDSQFLAAGDGNGIVTIWDAATGLVSASFQHLVNGGLGLLDWNPRLPLLLAGGGNEDLFILSGDTGGALANLRSAPDEQMQSMLFVSAAAWSPDGSRVASGRNAGGAQIWPLRVFVP